MVLVASLPSGSIYHPLQLHIGHLKIEQPAQNRWEEAEAHASCSKRSIEELVLRPGAQMELSGPTDRHSLHRCRSQSKLSELSGGIIT